MIQVRFTFTLEEEEFNLLKEAKKQFGTAYSQLLFKSFLKCYGPEAKK